MPGRSGYSAGFRSPTQITGFFGDLQAQAGMKEVQPYQGKTFIYGRFDDGVGNVAAVAGRAAYWRDIVNGIFTSDQSDTQLGAGAELWGVAGIFLYAMVDQRYGWIQCGGDHPGVFVNAAGAALQILIPSTVDGQLTTVATGALTAAQAGAQVVGRQLGAAVANLAPSYLLIREA